jgi:hypothetical protein
MMIIVITASVIGAALILILALNRMGLAVIFFIGYLMAFGGYIAASVNAHKAIVAAVVVLPLLVLLAGLVFKDRVTIRQYSKSR